jgi:nucleotide-binding universal stress UspA family protein
MADDVGFRRVLVPVVANEESERAVDLACRLAAGKTGEVRLLAVVEVPPLLPLNAHMADEEGRAHRLIERMAGIVESYDVAESRDIVRARDAASAIVLVAESMKADLVVIGAISGKTAEHVLKRAHCRVVLVGAPRPAVSAFAA